DELTGAIGPLAGHGTFIAGVVRQRSPRARLLSVPVLGADGVVEEYLVHTALRRILHRQQEALRSGDVDSLVDVVCLSMGYYDEEGDDSRPDSPLARLLRALAEAGVAVVAAAGNSAVDDPFYPAALALPRGAAVPDSGPPPIVSVGARNPDNTSVALFTNDGPWVTTHRPGAAIVSTVPTALQGGLSPTVVVGDRRTIDRDDFSSGFAIWSGTSFAAPVVAAEIATALAADDAWLAGGTGPDHARAAVAAVLDGRQEAPRPRTPRPPRSPSAPDARSAPTGPATSAAWPRSSSCSTRCCGAPRAAKARTGRPRPTSCRSPG